MVPGQRKPPLCSSPAGSHSRIRVRLCSLKVIPGGHPNHKKRGGRKTAPSRPIYQIPLPDVNVFFFRVANFSDLHKFFLCILYNIPYCISEKSVLSYSHKEKVLNDFSDAKKHIGGKQKLPKNRPLQKKHPMTEKEIFRMQSFTKDQ